uniref:RNA helicase n=1 Tax=Eptatretus burgeri TaxID=7764 RepID=A0A8C4WWE8_EPTBU
MSAIFSQHFVPSKGLQKELIKLMEVAGFSDHQSNNMTSSPAPNLSEADVLVLKAILTAGLYDNVGRVIPKTQSPADPSDAPGTEHSCVVETVRGTACIHPASVTRNLSRPCLLLYQEKVKLSRVFLSNCSVVSPISIMLFGGDISVHHRQRLVGVDGRIYFRAPARVGVIFKELRSSVDTALERKLAEPQLSLEGDPTVRIILELIRTENVSGI